MAKRELGPAALKVAQAVAALLPEGEAIVGVSGGADSLALAMGAKWAADRSGTTLTCIVVDHRLQEGSGDVAGRTVAVLQDRGLSAQVVGVDVEQDPADGIEAAARRARLGALAASGLPVLLGHTLDDQAESVLLGLLRGSGTRSLAGMAPVRMPFIRPLLGVRRQTTVEACRDWRLEWWDDPHNVDERFARVRARQHLEELTQRLGRDVAPALARTAELSRMDADLLEELAEREVAGQDLTSPLEISRVCALPPALRLRVLRLWLESSGMASHTMEHVLAVDALMTDWRGQGPVHLPGGVVARERGNLVAGRPHHDGLG